MAKKLILRFFFIALLSNALSVSAQSERLQSRDRHYSEWMVRSEMKRTPHSYLLDFSTKPKWSYVMGIELEAMLDTYLRYGGQDIMDYCREYVDTMVDEKGHIRGYDLQEYNLDHVRTGHFLVRMQIVNPELRLMPAIGTLMQQLDHQPRTAVDSVFWHKAIYAYQVWLDGIFMGLPFRVLARPLFSSSSFFSPSSEYVLGRPCDGTLTALLGPCSGVVHNGLGGTLGRTSRSL